MKAFTVIVVFCLAGANSEARTTCWSDVCLGGQEFCLQDCPMNFTQCSASVRIDHFGAVHPYGFHCVNRPGVEECGSSQCVMNVHGETHTCCCTGTLCNSIYGLTPPGGNHPTVQLPTSTPTGSPPEVPEPHQVCEFYNCSTAHTDNSSCFHGYASCSEDPRAESFPDTDHHHCVASFKKNETTNLYNLSYKGCHFVDPLIASHCIPGECHVEYVEGDSDLGCCCNGQYCNTDVSFSDPSKFDVGIVDPCERANCDSCLLTQSGETKCFCRRGYALEGQNNCVDINECLLGLDDCSSPSQCINTAGSYICECPLGFKLEGGNRCNVTGLTCRRTDCQAECSEPTRMYCDEWDTGEFHYCQATFLKLNNTLLPQVTSCLNYDYKNEDCTEGVCIPAPNSDSPGVYTCCCTGDLCNDNIRPYVDASTTIPVGTLSSSTRPPTSTKNSETTTTVLTLNPTSITLPNATERSQVDSNQTDPIDVITFAAISGLAVLVIISSVFVIVLLVMVRRKKWVQGPYLYPSGAAQVELEEPSLSQPFGLHLRLLERIGQGRFASVWKASIGSGSNTEVVAAKVFSNYARHKENFEHELSIYLTPQLQHQNILRYITNETKDNELYLVLAFHSNGSLYDLLKHRHITLSQFFKLSQGAAAGLAHLHSEDIQNGKCIKPAIAHRDLKSKNVLVMSDFTSCISDLGLAIRLDSANSADTHGQVGTARYMPPEVLEGAIYFQRESFQRIDVYALALIIWEIASRTEISGVAVEEYRPPFEEWGASTNTTVEEMTTVVVRERRRPQIPKGFLLNADLDEIVDTITEAWDEDAEGRLSASCIEERIRMLGKRLRQVETSKLTSEMSPVSASSSGGSTITPTKAPGSDRFGGHCMRQHSNWTLQIETLGSSPPTHHYSMNHFATQTEHHQPLNETTV